MMQPLQSRLRLTGQLDRKLCRILNLILGVGLLGLLGVLGTAELIFRQQQVRHEIGLFADLLAFNSSPVVAFDDARSAEEMLLNSLRRKPDRKSTRLNSSHLKLSRMPSSA